MTQPLRSPFLDDEILAAEPHPALDAKVASVAQQSPYAKASVLICNRVDALQESDGFEAGETPNT